MEHFLALSKNQRTIASAWIILSLVKTDSLNCETEAANRTLQTGSLSLPH